MNQEQNINISEEKDGKVITVLNGEAKKQANLENTEINGAIDSVSRFIENRKDTDYFKEKETHCIADTEEGILILRMNEQDKFGNYVVIGKIEESNIFNEIGINKAKRYDPIDLSNTFRLMRSYFISHEEHANLCATLKNVTAKVNQDVQKAIDDGANKNIAFRQEVESNIPKSFRMKLPIIKGAPSQEINVNVVLEADGAASIRCYLFSEDAQDFLIEKKEEMILKEVEKIEKDVLVIFK